jgi:hypothetical protein
MASVQFWSRDLPTDPGLYMYRYLWPSGDWGRVFVSLEARHLPMSPMPHDSCVQWCGPYSETDRWSPDLPTEPGIYRFRYLRKCGAWGHDWVMVRQRNLPLASMPRGVCVQWCGPYPEPDEPDAVDVRAYREEPDVDAYDWRVRTTELDRPFRRRRKV